MTSHPSPPPSENRQHPLSIGAAFTAVALLLSGCVVSPDETSTPTEQSTGDPTPQVSASPPREESEGIIPLASSITSSTELGDYLKIDIIALERLQNDILRLRIEITNNSNSRYRLYDGLGEDGDTYTASAVTLIDAENQRRYLSYDQSNGTCLCQSLSGAVQSGETVSLWVAFPNPPNSTERMTVLTPLTPPIFDIPISDSLESIEHQGISDPVILDLTMISDDLEDQTGRTESNDEVSIILSSDVLFDTNSADLNQEAEEILEQVAIEISDSTSTIVSVDGHADNTGNESVNQPLSLERAQAVESSLADLVTREGIEFDVNGYGSSEPIADNSTEEGRERNRRVSITFER
ncbi:OmpA family protein [Nocardiopsis sp. EMB25]|uniref:OmpA family protein n=1 Tax=Nocardiopsis sp. EMB25 TaxID=2835867 RepID=UPI002284370E|nr:OmpA family protein [Nocardiopsis sp. EMB25]MCY9782489.1 OmpA family protein [Nocardiopsis sp. EMB25]